MYSVQIALAQQAHRRKPLKQPVSLTAREILDCHAPRPVPIKTAAESGRPVKVVNSGVSNSTAPHVNPQDSPPLSTPSTPTGKVYDTSKFCVPSPSISPRTPCTPRTPGRSPTVGRSPLRERSQTAVYEPPPKYLDLTGLDPKDLDIQIKF